MPMRRIAPLLSLSLFAAAVGCGSALAADATAPTHHASKTSSATASGQSAALHALGVLISHQLGSFQLTDSELRLVLAGITDGVHHPGRCPNRRRPSCPSCRPCSNHVHRAEAEREEKIGQAYLAKAATLPNARTTASGPGLHFRAGRQRREVPRSAIRSAWSTPDI